MIYVLLSNQKNKDSTKKNFDAILQFKIIEFVKLNIKFNNLFYRMIFVDTHITDSEISFIDNENDIILWEPIVAYNNLELLKTFQNSIVILDRPSVYVQKVSKYNPINENMAINHGFYLLYINPDDVDITNKEWKLVVKDEMYLITSEKLIQFASRNESNIRKENLIHNENPVQTKSDIDKNQILKDQINLTNF